MYRTEMISVLQDMDASLFNLLTSRLEKAYQRDSLILICGNGGSGATASHFVCDLNKGVSYNRKKRFKAICLGDNISTVMAYANDISYNDTFVEQCRNFLTNKDLLVVISGSGNSENVVRALQYANSVGAETMALTGMGGGEISKIANYSIVVPSNDMQKVEDMHFVLIHCAIQWLNNKL